VEPQLRRRRNRLEQRPVAEQRQHRVDAALAAMGSFAPLADVMGMAHERADRRLFIS